ncbi:MAG: hypothetical protein L0099_01930 [Acidobacteria bacterium]|nr:hypothetical protein [Acidobacteriota bacterium]
MLVPSSIVNDSIVNRGRLATWPTFSYIPSAVYADFRAVDRWTREELHCAFQALVVAVATRHADAVDIKFLANGRPVWIALPHPAWEEHLRRTAEVLTDALAVEAAGHYLKAAIESGLEGGRDMYTLTVEETLAHLNAVRAELATAKASV